MAHKISVEVAYAESESQSLVSLSMDRGTTVADAIRKSGILDQFGLADIEHSKVGIWGHLVERNQRLQNGDRVEIYRPLEIEPREARRQLALTGRTMRKASS